MNAQMEAARKEARCWSIVSFNLGMIVIVGSSASGMWPVFLVQTLSVLGSMLFVCGGPDVRYYAFVLLALSAVFEAITAVVLLVIGIIFLSIAPGEVFGFGALIGIMSLVLMIPVAAIAAIDAYTAVLVRRVYKAGVRVAPLAVLAEPPSDAAGPPLLSMQV